MARRAPHCCRAPHCADPSLIDRGRGRVVLDWVRTRLVPFRREVLPPKLTDIDHDENGVMKDSHIFHSQFHDFVTLDTTPLKIDRDLKGRRLMQIVLRPFGMLRRADHSTERWQHFNR